MLTYLHDRFRADADTLRQRAVALRAGPPQPGPDAATSDRMADACEAVTMLMSSVPHHEDTQTMIDAILALVPQLEQRAESERHTPPVRAVFAGAATRIREVAEAERRHLENGTERPST